MVALGELEAEAARHGFEHLLARLRRPPLLDAGEVVDAHLAQHRELLAPQPVGATAGPAGEPDVLRLQRQATPAHEVGELLGIHPDSLHRRPHSRVPPLTSMR